MINTIKILKVIQAILLQVWVQWFYNFTHTHTQTWNEIFYISVNIFLTFSPQNSPKLLCPKDRTLDTDAIYSVVDNAEQFIYIAVMDYLPIVNIINETRWVDTKNLHYVLL